MSRKHIKRSSTFSDLSKECSGDTNLDAVLNRWTLVDECEDLNRHEEFWFQDGNIVLVATNTAFRVHAGLLSRASPVFRELFVDFEDVVSEQMDDCPLVRLDDFAEDLAALLSVIYGGNGSFGPNVSRVQFSFVASLIRLGHKYQIIGLRDDAVARLKTCFPSKFEEWDNFEKLRSSSMTMEKTDAITAVNLARLTENHSILPVALYGCCLLDTDTILFGTCRKDGSVERLSPEDTRNCIEGQRRLLRANRNALTWVFDAKKGSMDCELRESCSKILRTLPKTAHIEGILADWQALHPWTVHLDMNLCGSCIKMLETKDLEARRELWVQLPSYMGVSVEDWATEYVDEVFL
ncbi:hypothetical protein BKA93DRAFT_763419 [Sparassis latifolia]